MLARVARIRAPSAWPARLCGRPASARSRHVRRARAGAHTRGPRGRPRALRRASLRALVSRDRRRRARGRSAERSMRPCRVTTTMAEGRMAARGRDGRHAITHYRVRERFHDAALVELRARDGAAASDPPAHGAARPSAGGRSGVYGCARCAGYNRCGTEVRCGTTGAVRGAAGAGRQMLHAWRLAFPHPLRRGVIQVEAPLPEDFERAGLAKLRRLR